MARTVSLQISDALWTAVQREARRSGTSASTIVREGCVLRLAVGSVQGSEEDPRPTLNEILLELRRLGR
jgi:hypothetical protein